MTSVSPAPDTGVVKAIILVIQQLLVERLFVGQPFIHIPSPGILRQLSHGLIVGLCFLLFSNGYFQSIHIRQLFLAFGLLRFQGKGFFS